MYMNNYNISIPTNVIWLIFINNRGSINRKMHIKSKKKHLIEDVYSRMINPIRKLEHWHINNDPIQSVPWTYIYKLILLNKV